MASRLGPTRPRRRGTILICVLACLLVATGLAAHNLRRALRCSAERRHHHQRMQLDLLLDAGVRHAIHAAESQTDAAEGWMEISDLPGGKLGYVRIESETRTGETGHTKIFTIIAKLEHPPRKDLGSAGETIGMEHLRLQESYQFEIQTPRLTANEPVLQP